MALGMEWNDKTALKRCKKYFPVAGAVGKKSLLINTSFGHNYPVYSHS